MDDREIIALYWQRDEQAIEQTQLRYGAYCRTIAHNILGSEEDSAECVNDAYWHAWSSIPPERPANFKLFLARLTRNLALDQYRVHTAAKRGGGELSVILEELSECLTSADDVEDVVFSQELGQTIRLFVRSLPAREADLFVQRYFFSEPVSRIAKRFGLTAHHVTVILSRTRKKLKLQLEREGFFT